MVETISALPREARGKGGARRIRREGRIPAVIYGNKQEPVTLSLESRRLAQALGNPQFFIRLVDVELEGRKHRVLPREVQYHPVSDAPLHVDFLRFDPDRRIAVAVPVRFEGEKDSPGIKRGGILNVVRHEVEVNCTADNIPLEIVLDLSGLEIGESLHSSAVTLPEEVEFVISDRDFTIATIASPAVLVEETEEEAEGEEEAGQADEESAKDGAGD